MSDVKGVSHFYNASPTGVVVDCGYATNKFCPIYENYPAANVSINYGTGQDATAYMVINDFLGLRTLEYMPF